MRARALRALARVAQRRRPRAGRRNIRRLLGDPDAARPRRGDRRARRDQQRGRGDAGAADARRRRPADPRHGGRGAGDQHARSRRSTSPRRRWPASSPTPRKAPRQARRDVAVAIRQTSHPAVPPAADPAALRSRRRTSPTRRWPACAPRARTTSCSCPTLVALLRHRRLKGHAGRCSSATASRSSTRSRISCATPRKTSGCAGTSRRRWR